MLITWASHNMGRLAAFSFAREGANLAICTSTKTAERRQVRGDGRAFGAKVVGERYDVANGNFIEVSGALSRP